MSWEARVALEKNRVGLINRTDSWRRMPDAAEIPKGRVGMGVQLTQLAHFQKHSRSPWTHAKRDLKESESKTLR